MASPFRSRSHGAGSPHTRVHREAKPPGRIVASESCGRGRPTPRGSTRTVLCALGLAAWATTDVAHASPAAIEIAGAAQAVAHGPTSARMLPAARAAEIVIRRTASAGFELADVASSARVVVSLVGARELPGIDTSGATVFAGAEARGGDLAYVVRPDGAEDFVRLQRPPDEPAMQYRVSLLAGVAGLRLVSGVLELLDAGGTPRLRVARPYWIDARGRRGPATLTLEDCAFDSSARAPWGRPVTAPGRAACTIRVGWPASIAYPAVVDPAWTTTGSMADARSNHVAQLLGTGHVLVAGGSGDTLQDLSSAELYDPTSGTWAMTGSLAATHRWPVSAPLGGGGMLLLGDGLVERYDTATGAFTTAAPPNHARTSFALAGLKSGQVLLAGGDAPGGTPVPQAELFDPATGAWTDTGSLVNPADLCVGAALDDGRVLVTSAMQYDSTLLPSEIYDPTSGTWSVTGTMKSWRDGGQSFALLPDKRLLAVGSSTSDGVDTAEIFDPTTGQWTVTGGKLASQFTNPAIGVVGDSVLVIGGERDLSLVRSPPAEVYDIADDAWLDLGDHQQAWCSATTMAAGVLVAGGYDGPTAATAEIFAPASAGTLCALDGECASRFCSDGYCCDKRCQGSCEGCSVATKGAGPNGVCGPVVTGRPDPRKACAKSDPSTCGTDGSCDGNRGCAVYAAATVCTAEACATDGLALVSAACDGHGTCVPASVTCAPFKCDASNAQCLVSCQSDNECTGVNVCDNGQCRTAATCVDDHTLHTPDGNSTDCTPYRCADRRCGTTCGSVDDCSPGMICDGSGKCGAPISAPAEASSGCAVRGAAPPAGCGVLLGAVVAALAGLRRRTWTERNKHRGDRPG